MTKLGVCSTFIIGQASTETVADTLTSAGIDGACLVNAEGLWQGNLEVCVLAKVDGLTFERALELAGLLRERFKQECILLEHGGEAYLV